MSNLFILLTFVLLVYSPLASREDSGVVLPTMVQPKAADESGSLRLTTSIREWKYCSEETGDRVSLRMRLRLRYSNVGKTPIILYKESSMILGHKIARTEEELRMGQFESDSRNYWDTGPDVIFDESAPDARFVVLKTGKFYDVETTYSIGVPVPTAGKVPGLLAPGQHVWLIRVETWPASSELGESLRERWIKWGTLWYAPSTSLPMTFNVQKNPTIVDCAPQ